MEYFVKYEIDGNLRMDNICMPYSKTFEKKFNVNSDKDISNKIRENLPKVLEGLEDFVIRVINLKKI